MWICTYHFYTPYKNTHISPTAPTLWRGGKNPYPQRVWSHVSFMRMCAVGFRIVRDPLFRESRFGSIKILLGVPLGRNEIPFRLPRSVRMAFANMIHRIQAKAMPWLALAGYGNTGMFAVFLCLPSSGSIRLIAFDSIIWAIPIHRVMQADGCGVLRATAMFGMWLSVNPCGSDFSKYQ